MPGSAPTTLNEMIPHRPPPALAGYFDSIIGYRMSGFPAGVHLGMPSRSLTVIISYDDPLRLRMHPDTDHEGSTHLAMASGIHPIAVEIDHTGNQHGIQLNFTPQGARALFAMPSKELAGLAVDLDDLWPGSLGRDIYDRTADVAGWPQKFAALDAVLLEVLHRHEDRRHAVHAAASDTWDILCATDGRASISAIASELGWSRRLITARFTEEYGLTPKAIAGVLRFHRSVEWLRAHPTGSLAYAAAACGFSDHAHMTRQWRQICRTTPTGWLRDEVFPNVQDTAADDMRR